MGIQKKIIGSLSIFSIQPFAQFQHAITGPSLELTAKDYSNAHQYISVLGALYATEYLWERVVHDSLNKAIGFHLLHVMSEDGMTPSGSIMMHTPGNLMVPGGLYKLKDKVRMGSSDLAIQGSLSYGKVWASDRVHCMP